MRLEIPELALVLLVGPSGGGKSTFASRHFRRTEVVSSDEFRALVSDDPNNQAATGDAFQLLHLVVDKRLARRRLTVVDATNVQASARRPLLDLARRHHAVPVAIVFCLPGEVVRARARARTDRRLTEEAIDRQIDQLRGSVRDLRREGFKLVHLLEREDQVEGARVVRVRLPSNRRQERGPFDLIGDVHGCFAELLELLERLGYDVQARPGEGGRRFDVIPPGRRKAVFLGDLVDRGPDTPNVLRLAMDMERAGMALVVLGNHDIKLMKKLEGRNVRIAHGLEASLAQLEGEPAELRRRIIEFFRDRPSHYVLDGGRLVAAHGGMKRHLQGRASRGVEAFGLYGETRGEVDEFGMPVRIDWAREYRGRALVVYGHTPVPEPRLLNNTINIDTGCVFGHRLTALRYPERELVSVPAREAYAAPGRPFTGPRAGISKSGTVPPVPPPRAQDG